MKHLILITALLTACGTDSKDAGSNLVTADPEPKTEPTIEPGPVITTTEADDPIPVEPDPDGSPESGPVVISNQFKKFALAEADCTPQRCIVRIKVEQACNASSYTRIALMPYQLKDGFLFRATSVVFLTPDWVNGSVVTIELTATPTQDVSDYRAQGYLDQSGVMYNCPN